MDLMWHTLAGFLMAYIGLLPPGMMNMTAVQMSIAHSFGLALRFSAGAAIIVLLQSFIALTFTLYLKNNPGVLQILEQAAVVIFFLLALYFFMQARKKNRAEGKIREGSAFLAGLLMSSMNALAIPFYFGYGAIMEAKGWLMLEQPFISFFVIGAMLGAFSLFATYAAFARTIARRVEFIARNINYVLSAFFLLLAIAQMVKVML